MVFITYVKDMYVEPWRSSLNCLSTTHAICNMVSVVQEIKKTKYEKNIYIVFQVNVISFLFTYGSLVCFK